MKKTVFLVSSFVFAVPLSIAGTSTTLERNVHIIGDSHVAYSFTNVHTLQTLPTPKEPNWPVTWEISYFNYHNNDLQLSVPFHIHWISRTMHMVGKLGLEILDFKKFGVKDGDIVVLLFGGIDSYHGHLVKQYNRGRNLDEITDKLARNFVRTIVENQAFYRNMTIVIMGIIPPCYLPHNARIYVQREANLSFEKFIVLANRTLNAALEQYSKTNNFLYLDVTTLFENEQGILRPELSDGVHHVKPECNHVIKEKLVTLIIKDFLTKLSRNILFNKR